MSRLSNLPPGCTDADIERNATDECDHTADRVDGECMCCGEQVGEHVKTPADCTALCASCHGSGEYENDACGDCDGTGVQIVHTWEKVYDDDAQDGHMPRPAYIGDRCKVCGTEWEGDEPPIQGEPS